MRPVHVVQLIPDDELLPEIDVVGVVEQRVGLKRVARMQAFDLAVEVGARRRDVHVPDTEVLHVPVEPGRELVAVVRADRVEPEGEASDHMVDEVDRACRDSGRDTRRSGADRSGM